jgi:multicomponent Na+:H+ antiporter subunit D
MSGTWLLGSALAAPIAGAFAVLLARRRPNLRESVSLLAAAVLLGSVALLAPQILGGARPGFTLFQFLPGVAIAFEVEPLGITFALLAAVLWPITTIYAVGYMRAHGERHQTRFYAFFALAIGATIGGAMAANMLTLYLFYEALTLATYPLVTHGGTESDRRGGRTYLLLLLGTSLIFLVAAMAWTYQLAGTLAFTPGGVLGGAVDGGSSVLLAVLYALFLFGTGKAALMPFHRWLPAAMVAPTPVSALLHAVAVVKLGVFSILKVTVYIFGINTLASFDAASVMQYVAAATLLAAALLALREDNLKRRLAYSTISQLGYIVLAATLVNELSVIAGGVHIVAHALAKITLFFCAGVILVSLHKTKVSELRGVGRAMPVTFTAWIVASLCVIGLPLTGGFWSKWYLALGTLEAGEPLLLGAVLAGSLLAMGYLLPPAVRAFSASPESVGSRPARAEAPKLCLAALMMTATASVLLFFGVRPLMQMLQGMAH